MVKFRCAVTGANGYLGSVTCSALRAGGIEVVPLSRDGENVFNLRDGVDADFFRSRKINCLIHCAWDFKANNEEYVATNVGGSVKLFKAAHEAGVDKMIFISSMSAFDNCKSRYGATKYKTEIDLLSMGALVVRPGLVYGDKPRGMLGVFTRLVKFSPIIPLVGGGGYVQYTTHEEDLGMLLKELATFSGSTKMSTIVAANHISYSLKEILKVVSAKAGKKTLYLPIPWRIIWAILVTAEKIKIDLPLKSDSIIGLVFPNENPNFDGLYEYKSRFRTFKF